MACGQDCSCQCHLIPTSKSSALECTLHWSVLCTGVYSALEWYEPEWYDADNHVLALALLRDDLFRVCSGSDHAEAFPAGHVPVVAATACVVPFLLDPAAALGRMSPWHMKLRCLDLVAAFLLGVSTAVCTRHPPDASVLARFSLPAWSSVRAWLLRSNRVRFCPGALACG